MQITIETTKSRRRFKLTVNRIYQGCFGIQRILERVAVSMASHQEPEANESRVGRVAMDALDFAAAAMERVLKVCTPGADLTEAIVDPAEAEADFQALREEVRGDAELAHAWEHASAAFGLARRCESRASALGTIAAGLATGYALLGEETTGEDLRALFEESEPLVTLLLNLHERFDNVEPVRISAPGGEA